MKKLTTALSRVTGRVGLQMQKRAPEIFLIGGIISIGTGVIFACKAARKQDEIIDRHNEKKARIKDAYDNQTDDNSFAEKEYKKELTVIYTQTGVDWLKLYGLPSILIIGGVGLILNSHNIMRKRNAALTAAYNTLAAGFAAYRQRVIEEHGEETDYMYRHGLRKQVVEETIVDENGKSKKVKTEKLVVDPNALSIYAKFYDNSCNQWTKDPYYNMQFLLGQQKHFNHILKVRGHVFLNEIYDVLGIERMREGQTHGWIYNGDGDGFIDFGIFDDNQDPRRRAFVNGYEDTIILDFNVDGYIYDLI